MQHQTGYQSHSRVKTPAIVALFEAEPSQIVAVPWLLPACCRPRHCSSTGQIHHQRWVRHGFVDMRTCMCSSRSPGILKTGFVLRNAGKSTGTMFGARASNKT
eukprot:5362595-Amphidinium_carterae.2